MDSELTMYKGVLHSKELLYRVYLFLTYILQLSPQCTYNTFLLSNNTFQLEQQ